MQESPIVFLVVVALVRRAAVRFGVACAGIPIEARAVGAD
jgi:hypothetical protein